jgi:fumarylacetoacetate (FAA) hydrolase
LSQDWGIDLEAEVAVITGDVPMGASEATAMAAIRLVMLVNDVSLRNLIPEELAKGFGFYQSKPATAFSPVAVTPDELAPFWFGDKLQRALHVSINGRPFGRPDAGTDMAFGFGQLIAHAAKTRELGAGTIIGSGTVSNKTESLSTASIENGGVGFCCISELRMVETIQTGKPQTPYLAFGDRVRIEMFDRAGYSIFGAIDQEVAHYSLRQSTRRGTAV